MDFLKSTAGKIVTGLIALVVIAGVIFLITMDPAVRSRLIDGAGKIAAWIGIVLVLPWATFAIIARVARLQSNRAGAILIFIYTGLETAGLAWLFDWHLTGHGPITFLILGGLLAAVYNLLTCDWIAEKLE